MNSSVTARDVKGNVIKLGMKMHGRARLFRRGCCGMSRVPHACSLIMSHRRAGSSFLMFIFEPGAGNLLATTKWCQNAG